MKVSNVSFTGMNTKITGLFNKTANAGKISKQTALGADFITDKCNKISKKVFTPIGNTYEKYIMNPMVNLFDNIYEFIKKTTIGKKIIDIIKTVFVKTKIMPWLKTQT